MNTDSKIEMTLIANGVFIRKICTTPKQVNNFYKLAPTRWLNDRLRIQNKLHLSAGLPYVIGERNLNA